MKDGIASRR